MTLLLRNGVALIHGESDEVTPTRTDILIEGNIIKRIEPDIVAFPETKIIDCTNKVIGLSFIDAHQHVWQTFNKARHADDTLLGYAAPGGFTSNIHSREEIFWGQLGGCLNLLNAGTTTVVDHAHINVFPGSSEVAIFATVSSGIRSLFCYAPTLIVKSWSPIELYPNILEPWVTSDLASLIQKAPFNSSGRVRLGLGFDGWDLPVELTQPFFATAQNGGIDFLTAHVVESAIFPFRNDIEKIQASGVSFQKVLLSHATELSAQQVDLLVKNDFYVVSTPSTELHMGYGRPVCFDENLRSRSCLGGDFQSNGGFSIPEGMWLGLQAERIQSWKDSRSSGNWDGGQDWKYCGGEVGRSGVFDGDTPAMICAAQNDPVAAIVLFSAPSDISWVIVDGVVKKSGGKLCLIQVEDGGKEFVGEKDVVDWKNVAKHVLKAREGYYEGKFSKIDFRAAEETLVKAWGLYEQLTDET
ncbi:hypothetical protein V5O48_016184 [Marasmius crinis-equi]|uniref:Amidohydrolase-related domain-containing protein n=1 Tax=Marasmius crinis-equi TaxID=585013 RepID=A0ABR3ESQ8_9AGAR